MSPGDAVITPTMDVGRVVATQQLGMGAYAMTAVEVELPNGAREVYPQSSLAVRRVNKVCRPFQIIQGGRIV